MGADFTWGTVPAADRTAARTRELRKLIAVMDEDALVDWASYPFDGVCSLEGIETRTPNNMRRLFYTASLEAWDRVMDESRETATLRLDGMDYDVVLTAGMSWGDSPTDIFPYFTVLSGSDNVYRLFLKWAREDYAARVANAS